MAFQEKNAAEQGFSAIWDAHIAPAISRYRGDFFRTRRFAILGAVGYFALVIPAIIWAFQFIDRKNEGEFQVFVLIAFAVSAGWFYITSKAFFDEVKRFDEFMRASVAQQFAPIFKLQHRNEKAMFYANLLQHEGMTKKGDAEVSNYHIGRYRECSLEFFNVCYERMQWARHGRRRRRRSYFLVVAVGVPVPFRGEIHIKRDYGPLVNWMRGKALGKRRFKVSHRGFENKFEIYADDANSARQLVSRSFCNNLMAIERMYPKGFGLVERPMTALFKDGKFFLVIGNVRDLMSDGISYSHPDKVQQTARRMIARLAVMPRIVDYLHGRRR